MKKTIQKQLLNLITRLLYARKSRNIKREQVEYDKIRAFCDKHDIDFSCAIEQGIDHLKTHSIAANMNGIV